MARSIFAARHFLLKGPAMGYRLRSGISFCDVSGQLLFLDIVADRYFCLQPEAERGFRDLLAQRSPAAAPGPVAGHNPDAASRAPNHAPSRNPHRNRLAAMLRTGMLIETDDQTFPCPYRPGRHATLSLLDTPEQEAGLLDVAAAMMQIIGARFSLRHRTLHDIVRALDLARCPWPRSGKMAPTELQAAASAFERTSRFMRSHDQCLPRSIALARHLAARNLPAELVMGVKLRPFAAHAWVQSGPWLLNDRIDTIRNYTPILAV